MQDDYVGLGDLLTLRDEDGYEVIQTEKFESDPVNKLKYISLKFLKFS